MSGEWETTPGGIQLFSNQGVPECCPSPLSPALLLWEPHSSPLMGRGRREGKVGLTPFPFPFPFPEVGGLCKLVRGSLFQKSLMGRACDPEPFLRGLPFPPMPSSNHPSWNLHSPPRDRPALQLLPMWTAPGACRTTCPLPPQWAGVGGGWGLLHALPFVMLPPARAAHICCSQTHVHSQVLRNVSLEHSRKYPCLHRVFLGNMGETQRFHLVRADVAPLRLSRSTAFTWGRVHADVSW